MIIWQWIRNFIARCICRILERFQTGEKYAMGANFLRDLSGKSISKFLNLNFYYLFPPKMIILAILTVLEGVVKITTLEENGLRKWTFLA